MEIIDILKANLNTLVNKLETKFNVTVNDFGVENYGSQIYQNAVGDYRANFLGYFILPSFGDEINILKNNYSSNSSLDLGDIMGMMNLRNGLIDVNNIIEFCQLEFAGKMNFLNYPISKINKNNELNSFDEDDHNYITIFYIINL